MFDCYAMKLVEDWKARELAKIARAGAYTPELVSRAFEVEHFELFPKKAEDASEKFLADAELAYQGRENPRVVKTGLPSLDKLIGGFEKSELITLGGYSGGGKTTLALNIATNVAKEGRKVVYFSLEMTKAEMHKRLVCSSTGVSDFANMSPGDFNRLIEASKSLEHDLPLEFADDSDTTVEKSRLFVPAKRFGFGCNRPPAYLKIRQTVQRPVCAAHLPVAADKNSGAGFECPGAVAFANEQSKCCP